jgi:hypothetical protein
MGRKRSAESALFSEKFDICSSGIPSMLASMWKVPLSKDVHDMSALTNGLIGAPLSFYLESGANFPPSPGVTSHGSIGNMARHHQEHHHAEHSSPQHQNQQAAHSSSCAHGHSASNRPPCETSLYPTQVPLRNMYTCNEIRKKILKNAPQFPFLESVCMRVHVDKMQGAVFSASPP